MIRFFQRLFRLPHLHLSKQAALTIMVLFPSALPLSNYIWLGNRYFTDWKVFVSATVVGLLICFLLLLVQIYLIKKVIHRFPALEQSVKRGLLELGITLLISVAADVVAIVCYQQMFPFFDYTKGIYWILLIGFVANVINVALYEVYYSMHKWREKSLQTEMYKREALMNQLEVLKNQVNPHFLFNGLNSLASLISEDPPRAEVFVNEFSQVYRYMLQVNAEELCLLSQELRFIHSYYYLLKSRYQDGLDLTVDVNESYREKYIPPLTLQLLVENAVKHNTVLRTSPVHIHIGITEAGWLYITNNIQPRLRKAASNGVGLSNIVSKYELLQQPAPSIEKTEHSFRVELSLLENIPANIRFAK